MSFNYFNGCSESASCPSADNCPGAFTDPTNGAPVQCLGTNVGVSTLLLYLQYWLLIIVRQMQINIVFC